MMLAWPNFTAKNSLRLIILGSAFFSFVYFGAALFPFNQVNSAPIIDLDASIAWIPWTVTIYLSQFIYIPLALLYAPDYEIATRTYYAYLLATLIAGFIFLFFPSQLPQKDLANVDLPMLFSLCYQFIYYTDVPGNCFPSLHTMLALIAATSLRQRGTIWQIVASLWTLAIMISTLTTKQHCILDVIAGMLLFYFGVWLFPKWFDRRINGRVAFTNSTNR